jgi:very-short-patch-repair endonuclease
MSYIYNQQGQKDLRKTLRRNQSSIERLLWSKLRNRQLLGFKFRRQYGIGPFCVDCYCPLAKLVIEEDGDSHYINDDIKLKDKERQKYIEDLGFTVLRFTNKEIAENIEGVLETISNYLKNNLTHSTSLRADSSLSFEKERDNTNTSYEKYYLLLTVVSVHSFNGRLLNYGQAGHYGHEPNGRCFCRANSLHCSHVFCR